MPIVKEVKRIAFQKFLLIRRPMRNMYPDKLLIWEKKREFLIEESSYSFNLEFVSYHLALDPVNVINKVNLDRTTRGIIAHPVAFRERSNIA